jgi:hypothetical protein
MPKGWARHTRGVGAHFPGSPRSRPTAARIWNPRPACGPLLTRKLWLSTANVCGQRSGSSPAHTNSLYTSTQFATSCPSFAGARRRRSSLPAGTRPPLRRATSAAARRSSPSRPTQRLADLTRGEPVLPSARLALPRLQPRGALNTERVRLPLARQDRSEPMLRIPIRLSAAPPLTPTPTRRLPIPPVPHHPRASVLSDRTLRNLHRAATLSLQPDISTQIE